MKIGIFGGTFDPFTIAHRAIVDKVLESGKVDEVFILPTIVNYYRTNKNTWLTDSEKCNCIFEMMSPLMDKYFVQTSPNGCGYTKWNICNDELYLRKTMSSEELSSRRTYHIVRDFKKKYPNDELFFIVGTDSAMNFKTWYRYEDVLKYVRLIVVNGRNDVDASKLNFVDPNLTISIDDEFSSISATDIRSRYSNIDEYLKEVKYRI